jgi:phage tail sheath gpL-like
VSGTANPLIDTAIAALGARPYTHIVMPYTDSANLALLDEELERRWSATVQKEALAFAGKSGTLGTATTFGTSRNEKAVSVMPTGPSPTPPWIFGAVVAAVDAAEPIPNRPRQTLALPGVLAPAEGAEWGLAEHEVLLHDGLSTYTVDPDGTVRIGRLVTTYQTNAYGLPDDAYLDVEKMTLLARLRYERRTRIAHKFGRNRLAANSQRIPPGSDIITTDDIRDDFFAQFIEWIEAGWVYDDMPALKAGYVCEIDPNDPNRVNELIPPELVGGLRVFAGLIQFRN